MQSIFKENFVFQPPTPKIYIDGRAGFHREAI